MAEKVEQVVAQNAYGTTSVVFTRGGVSPWLHAWVEWLGPDGRWAVADATGRELEAGRAVAGLPASPAIDGARPGGSIR